MSCPEDELTWEQVDMGTNLLGNKLAWEHVGLGASCLGDKLTRPLHCQYGRLVYFGSFKNFLISFHYA